MIYHSLELGLHLPASSKGPRVRRRPPGVLLRGHLQADYNDNDKNSINKNGNNDSSNHRRNGHNIISHNNKHTNDNICKRTLWANQACVMGDPNEVTDGIGTPDPNPVNLVSWCF